MDDADELNGRRRTARPGRRSGRHGSALGGGRRGLPRGPGDGDGRTAGEGHADRQHDQAAAGRGARGTPGRGEPGPAQGDPRQLGQGAGGRAGARAGRGAGAAVAALHRRIGPSDAELRIAQAQLVGWLEGLFHGIQTTLFAQQMAARAQLEQMRRALPPGGSAARRATDDPRAGGRSGGPYL